VRRTRSNFDLRHLRLEEVEVVVQVEAEVGGADDSSHSENEVSENNSPEGHLSVVHCGCLPDFLQVLEHFWSPTHMYVPIKNRSGYRVGKKVNDYSVF